MDEFYIDEDELPDLISQMSGMDWLKRGLEKAGSVGSEENPRIRYKEPGKVESFYNKLVLCDKYGWPWGIVKAV